MSDQKELQRYIMGEIRVDGWKSDWRKNFEANLSTPEPMRIVAQDGKAITHRRPCAVRTYRSPEDQIKHRRAIVSKALRKKREIAKEKGVCTSCFQVPSIEQRTLCEKCRLNCIERSKRRRMAA